MNYVIKSRIHPPSDLIASLYTKRLARGVVGGGIPIRRSSVEIILSLDFLLVRIKLAYCILFCAMLLGSFSDHLVLLLNKFDLI